MIRVLIIEDEIPAAEYLQKIITSSDFDIQIEGILNSVKAATRWFNNSIHPDLVFMDIQLSDGLSFDIFNYTKINCPVIFTTAYEEYAIQAFKVNSIDYLLKPVSIEALSYAVRKFLSQANQKTPFPQEQLNFQVDQVMNLLTKKFKTRFVVNAGMHIKSIDVESISCFYSLEKTTYLQDFSGKSYDLSYSLEQLEELIDPEIFFRINRKYLVNRNAIVDIISFSPNKLKIKMKQLTDDDIFISRGRLKDFRAWLEK